MPPRIVVVDDDPAILDALCDVLGEAGYEVAGALDGRAALKLVSPRPQLFVIDLMMPELDGWELISELQRTAPLAGIPICVLSAITSHAPPPDVAAVLRKPVSLDDLLETVNKLVGAARA
jgi:CheY-like chemotaxis protein